MDENTPAIDPRHSALLVMDYQAGIVGRIADADELLVHMRAAIDLARERGMTVGYVRVALTDDERDSVPERNKTFSALAAQRSGMHADAPGDRGSTTPSPRPWRHRGAQAARGSVHHDRPGRTARRSRHRHARASAASAPAGSCSPRCATRPTRTTGCTCCPDATADSDPEVHEVLMTKVFPRQAWVITTDEPRQAAPWVTVTQRRVWPWSRHRDGRHPWRCSRRGASATTCPG